MPPDGTPSPHVQFDVCVPCDTEQLRSNIRHALSLGLPELRDFEYPQDMPLSIYASGPSVRGLDGSAPPPHSLCVNGAIRLFAAPPTYWAGCDPQPELADFLASAPSHPTYLVASKCHPSVFEALAGRNVVLWHVWEPETADLIADRVSVSPGVSITSTVPELMLHLGYREFDIYGWDGCFGPDGSDHALPQRHRAGEEIDIRVGDTSYHTTTSWAVEAQDTVARLIGWPYPITIHGGGFIGAVLASRLPNRVQLAP